MTKDPIEAFAWLLEQFRHYTHNQTTWLQVREVLSDAETMREAFRAEQLATRRIIADVLGECDHLFQTLD